MKQIFTAFLMILILQSCRAQQASTTPVSDEPAIAFPGAEGFGKYTTGGRGGKVIIVSNLEDAGAGSFRDAVTAKFPRMIVFSVTGTIHLQSPLRIAGNVTIAGQSAPGGGICIADQPVSFGGDNIIIRFIRFRMGDKYQNGGMVDGKGADDALGGTHRKYILIDHCSISWSTDEAFSVYAGDSTTLQWNLISEPLNYSYHFETGDKDFEHHGYGAIWGGRHSTFHHNLFAHCNSRTPRFDGIRNSPEENCDYRNNVIYNWGGNNVYAGEGGRYNIVSNYYKPGPESKRRSIVNPFKKAPAIPFGNFYVWGNIMVGNSGVINDNWSGVEMNEGNENDKNLAKLTEEVPSVAINMESAEKAYKHVLESVGAILPERDTLDQRIIKDVVNGSGRFIDVQGGFPHGTPYELTVNAWPALAVGKAPADTDQDGMPDTWEQQHQLDPNNAGDAILKTLDKNYTNIEMYLESLVHPKK